MKRIFFACSALVLLVMTSCQSTTESKSTTDSVISPTEADLTPPATTVFDPDPTDTIPGDKYQKNSADTTKAAIIRTSLQTLLQNDIASMMPEDRKFKYQSYDLNNDGQEELIVGFYGPYFCGSGGCSGYILKPDGSLLNRFSVTQYPIYVAPSQTNGYQDLIVDSKGYHLVKMNGGKYPSNPSVQQAYKEELPNAAPRLLDIYNGAYPAFSF